MFQQPKVMEDEAFTVFELCSQEKFTEKKDIIKQSGLVFYPYLF